MVLIAMGLATELIGNIGTQWGYSIVGLAVMIPATTGFLLVATAVFGAVLLGERVSARNAAALALLIVALIVLGYGISQASMERQNDSPATAETGQQPLLPVHVAGRRRHRRGRRLRDRVRPAGDSLALQHRAGTSPERRGRDHHRSGRR